MKKLIAFILLAVIMTAALTGCGAKSVSAESLIRISFSGLDGEGTANPDFAYVDFEKAVMSGWKEKDQTWENLAALTMLEGTISCEADKTSGLHNGDKVKVTLSYDKNKAKAVGVSFKDLSKTFTVEGLQEPIYVDPFDPAVFATETGINIMLDGTAPFASLSIENNCAKDQPHSKIIYQSDNGYNLKNGDSITVVASLSGNAQKEGYILTRTETTLQAEGLDSYITDVSQLLPEDVDKLRSNLEDNFFNTVVPHWISFYPEGHDIYSGTTDASPNNSTVSNFGFDQNGWALVRNSWITSPSILVPVHFDLERREVYWVGTQHYDPPLTLNHTIHGIYEVTGLTLDGDTGRVNGESARITLLNCYESEEEMLSYVRNSNDPEILFAGTFVK